MKRRAISVIFAASIFRFAAAQTSGPSGGESETSAKSIPQDLSAILESGTGLVDVQAADQATTVTGKATTVDTNPDLVAIAPNQKSEQQENGLVLGVELLNPGEGTVNPKELTLHTPYPAKPLAAAPAGWHLAIAENAPDHTRVVQLAPGVKMAFSIKPHVLIPESDGAEIFAIAEPGYDPSRGDQQTTTVGAILATSVNQLDEDCIQLGSAIDNLQQLLISLPQPEPQSALPAAQGKKR